jgi:AcrR family transcriptional regulator
MTLADSEFLGDAGQMRQRSKSRRRTQEERREEAERRILDAATRLIADKGLDAFTLADVGEAAGFSRGLPAHYFKSKDGLLMAVVRRLLELHFGLWYRPGSSDYGLEDMFAATKLYFEESVKDPQFAKALHVIAAGSFYSPKFKKLSAQLNTESISMIERVIRTGIEKGSIRSDIDPRIWSAIFLAAATGLMRQWLADPKNIDLRMAGEEGMAAMRKHLTQTE